MSAPWNVPPRAISALPLGVLPSGADRLIASTWVPDPLRFPDACWIWQGAVNGTHRGQFHLYSRTTHGEKHRSTTAPRAAYILFIGDLADDEVAMHTCDNPMCVRPSHLRRGTQAENMADMQAKGRARFQRRAA